MRRRCETQNFSERKLDDESQDSVQTVLNFEDLGLGLYVDAPAAVWQINCL